MVKRQEAESLRDAGVKKPVLLMGPVAPAELTDLHRRGISPMVYTPIGDALDRAAAAAGRRCRSTCASTPASAASACRTARPTRWSAISRRARACASTA